MTSLFQTVLRGIYTALFILSIPAILLRLWWRGRKNPGYRERWLERFGIFQKPLQKRGIWVHAVSLGESIAAVPLIRQLQQRFPELPMTVTTTTPTGSAFIKNTFPKGVFHVYFPYDLPGCFKRFLKRVNPQVVVIMETELWPNCLWICHQQKIPVLVANGCLSLQSLQGYNWISLVTRMMLKCLTRVLAQTKLDGDRFLQLGLSPDQLVITGNMKFDLSLKEGLEVAAQSFRQSMGRSRPIWVAASTHAGEEEPILDAFSKLQQQIPTLLLILVPRHPERFQTVADLLKSRGFSTVTRSSALPIVEDTAVFLGDTLGELMLFYAASDVAFVGGSMVPIGGHNTLEPAACGVPVIVGSYAENIVEVTKLLSNVDALIQVEDSDALVKAVLYWLSSEDIRKKAGVAARGVVERNRGAVAKVVIEVEKIMNGGSSAVSK